MNFRIIYILFFILAVANRYRMMLAVKARRKIPGNITAGWTFKAMLAFYHIMAFGTLVDFLFVPRSINYWVSISGLILYFFGIIAREWAVKTLNEYWSVNIEMREGQKLIKTGPYRYLRHPNYLCLACEVLGFPLIFNSFYFFAFALMVYLPLILIRVYLEEKELISQFGQEYIYYRNEAWAFFPLPVGKKGVRL